MRRVLTIGSKEWIMIEKNNEEDNVAVAASGANAESQNALPSTRHLTMRERLALLFDHLPVMGENADYLLTATGKAGGRRICAVSQDTQHLGNGMDAGAWLQVERAAQHVQKENVPLVMVFDGTQTRLDGGIAAWSSLGRLAGTLAAHRALKVALVVGHNTGPNALLAGLFDVVVMVRSGSDLTLTDAAITNRVTHTSLSDHDLGGWQVHAGESGVADLVFNNEVLALRAIKRLLRVGTDARNSATPQAASLGYCVGLDTLVPDDTAQSYDVTELLRQVSDTRAYYEMGGGLAQNIVTAFLPVGGHWAGVIANQNKTLAGALDNAACRKAARFVRLCNALDVPLVTLVDTPGFVPGFEQESGGLAHSVADLLRRYAKSHVAKITMVVGKAYGAAGVALSSAATAPSRVVAWDTASIGLAGPKGIHDLAPAQAKPLLQALAAPNLLQDGALDAVLRPGDTRRWLGQELAALSHASDRQY
ncbi:MAG: hypothetical protein CML16_13915 [Pusillimonas sp.]|nr:hypothetical protein [Pusillimonas sp.]MBC41048.1 hypothetical protein [Pusillimonas sp.]HCP79245.1 hypothetical protein [Pusillimonas sp.]